MDLLQRIVTIGTHNGMVEGNKRTIRIVNTLCITTAVMASIFGITCYFLTGEPRIVFPALMEAGVFLLIIALNACRLYTLAGIGMILVNNVAVTYYSAVVGDVTEVHLLFIFLLGASLLIFRDPALRVAAIVITFLCSILSEVNHYYLFIKPLLTAGNHYKAQFIIRWVTVPSILALDVMVIYYYMKNSDRLKIEQASNKELEKKTGELARATLAKTIFVRETSHEIRTPLNAIFGISQLLQLKVEQDRTLAPIRQLVDHLYTASYNTREIINNVLEFSRIEAGKQDTPQAASFNVREWVDAIISMHRYVANVKAVKVRSIVTEAVPELIWSDKILLTKMVNNLLSNAIKFTTQDSTVTLQIAAEAGNWLIQVTDEGAGISEEKQATIFDAFVTERNVFLEGTGLGLHITSHLAALLGGRIAVSSSKGTGTTFTVTMPLAEGKEGIATDNGYPGQLCNLHDTNILIIEDDKMSQLILDRYLSGLGSRVMLAEDGVQGMLLAKAVRPDIIILDAHIPGLSGKQILSYIREDSALKEVPVIISSGDAFKEACEEMLHAGANEYVVKPIEFRALHALLGKYVGNKTTHS